MTLLADAQTGIAQLPEQIVFDALEQHHYMLWQQAQAAHQEKNRQRVEHRLQSLRSSHAMRVALLHNILENNPNPKIQTMKQSELHNAEADYQYRVKKLIVIRAICTRKRCYLGF